MWCSVTQSSPTLWDPMDCNMQVSLSFISRRLLKLRCVELVIPSNHLVFCCPVSYWLQSFSASGSFQMSEFFASGGQWIGASASVLPMNIQGLFPLGLTGLISSVSKGLSRVFSSTKIWNPYPTWRVNIWAFHYNSYTINHFLFISSLECNYNTA